MLGGNLLVIDKQAVMRWKFTGGRSDIQGQQRIGPFSALTEEPSFGSKWLVGEAV